MQIENFGRNVLLTPVNAYSPASEAEVLEILNRHQGQKIRCIGRLHSWSEIIAADDVLLDLRKLCSVNLSQDNEHMYVDVGAGCQIKTLLDELQSQRNWTLPSIGFITEQTIAGAISTGTHGSGRHSLSHYVMSVRIARYDSASGQAISQEIEAGDELLAARCSLGCLGIILSVRMQCRSAYAIEEHFREYESLESVLDAEGTYPLQQFYLVPWRWTYIVQHRRETLAKPSALLHAYQWYRYLIFDWAMHLLILLCVRILNSGMLVRSIFRWILPHCVLRNWRVCGPSNLQLVMEHELFRHVEIELFVTKSQLRDALGFVRNVLTCVASAAGTLPLDLDGERVDSSFTDEMTKLRGSYCHHYPICVRRILNDATLVSMASSTEQDLSQNSAAIAGSEDSWYSITLTNYHRGRAREPFEQVASFLAQHMARRYGSRPHWGKLCPLNAAELRKLYPAFNRFTTISEQFDPLHVFSNRWTEQLLSNTCDLNGR